MEENFSISFFILFRQYIPHMFDLFRQSIPHMFDSFS